MSDTFSDPGTGGGAGGDFDMKEALGHLLIIRPLEFIEGMETSFGVAPVIRANVADVDANTIAKDVLIFGKKITTIELAPKVGQQVLGVLGQAPAQPGKNPAWTLIGAAGDPDAVKRAMDFLAVNGATWNGLSNPAPAPAAVAAPVI